MKIVSATVGPYPQQFGDPMPKVTVTLDTGDTVPIFEFYPDEINFTPQEFIGLTLEQAQALKGKKDREYLRS